MKKGSLVLLVISLIMNACFLVYAFYQKNQADIAYEQARISESLQQECMYRADRAQAEAREAMEMARMAEHEAQLQYERAKQEAAKADKK
jgi:hypothetical protein